MSQKVNIMLRKQLTNGYEQSIIASVGQKNITLKFSRKWRKTIMAKNEVTKVYDREYLVWYHLSFESDISNDVAPLKGTLVMNVVGEPIFEELEERIKKYVFRLNEREIPMNKITVKVIRVEKLDH